MRKESRNLRVPKSVMIDVYFMQIDIWPSIWPNHHIYLIGLLFCQKRVVDKVKDLVKILWEYEEQPKRLKLLTYCIYCFCCWYWQSNFHFLSNFYYWESFFKRVWQKTEFSWEIQKVILDRKRKDECEC